MLQCKEEQSPTRINARMPPAPPQTLTPSPTATLSAPQPARLCAESTYTRAMPPIRPAPTGATVSHAFSAGSYRSTELRRPSAESPPTAYTCRRYLTGVESRSHSRRLVDGSLCAGVARLDLLGQQLVGCPQDPKKERKKEMGHSRSQHFMLDSRDIESVTRRVGRWGFSKVYPWNGRIQP